MVEDGQRHALTALAEGRNPLQEGRWAPGPVWTGTENFSSTGVRAPDGPALASCCNDYTASSAVTTVVPH
jgi:hypothetical protein